MFKLKPKTEKIYKFVYDSGSGYYSSDKKTVLLTACDPVQAVKQFNKMMDSKPVNITEFTEVKHKVEESN